LGNSLLQASVSSASFNDLFGSNMKFFNDLFGSNIDFFFAARSYPIIELLQLCNHGVSFIKCSCHLDPCLYNTFLYCFLQEHHIQTKHGPVSVAVYGDHDKHALITYPDIALNRKFYY
jgi:hypothetical protein